ncbi:MAG TPA: tetratricopeptide repeat protein [Acidimicrobiales bacterium]|nr:tetratricopeptide repeat protein [Acidimicrobiales bacterium]
MSTGLAGAGPAPTERLEEERDFLLASLRDLEAERAAGDIADDDYRRLRDTYTARAAAVLRALDGEAEAPGHDGATTGTTGSGSGTGAAGPRSAAPSPGARRRLRTVAVAGAVLAGAGLAGWGVAASSGDRSSVDEATGSLPENSVDRITRAQLLVSEGRIMEAIRLYDALLDDDPGNPVALAQRGWLISRVSPELVDTGLENIDQAIAADPAYPEAHFFRGMILWRSKGDPAAGAAEIQKAIDAGTPASARSQLEQLRDEALAAAAAAAGSTTTAP